MKAIAVGHRFDRVRRGAARGGDADVVEGDHASIRGERIDERRIPVVEIAAEVLQQDERHPAYTEVAIGVVDRVAGSDSSARSVGVSHSCFGPCPFFGDGHWPVPSCTRVSRQRRP